MSRAFARPLGRASVILIASAVLAASCGAATQSQSSPTPQVTVAASATPAPTATPIPAPADLVAAGKLRIVLDPTSPAIGTRMGPNDFKGPGWDIALELGRRIGVKVEAVEATGAKVDELAAANGWDIGIVVLSTDMDGKYANAGGLLRAETGYLVPAGSAIKTMADVDKAGVTVAMFKTASTYKTLEAAYKNAKLVGVSSVDEAIDLLRTGKAQAFANAKPRMAQAMTALPGSVIIDGAIATTDYGIYGPKSNDARLAYLKQFVASIKTSGFLKTTIDKFAVPGLIPVP